MAKKKNRKTDKKIAPNTQAESVLTEPENGLDVNDGLLKSLLGNRIIVSVFLFILSFVVFIPSLSNEFVWDDISYIQKKSHNLNYSQLGSNLILPEIKEGKTAGKYFRPLFGATLILDNEIWNTSPFGFHLTNIILHCVSTILLYFLVLILLKEFRIKGRESIALISSFLFALYPLHVESVSFISARGDILAAIFFFLSFIFYIFSYKKLFYLFLSALCFFLSFISKEVAIALPIVIISFDLASGRLMNRTNLIKYIIIGLAAFSYFLLRSKSYLSIEQIMYKWDVEISQGFLHISDLILNTYLFYFIKLIFPYSPNPFIDSIPNWGIIGLLISIVLLLALCVAVFMSIRKKENLTAFSLLWILATLIPAAVVAIIPIALTRLADRFLYLPSVGICILFAYIIYEIGKKFKTQIVSLVLTLLIAVSFAVVTVNSQKVWKSNLTLWENAVLKSPESASARLNYGDALRNSGRPSESLEQFLYVYENSAHFNKKAKRKTAQGIIVSYIDLGNYQHAEKWMDQNMKDSPNHASHYYYFKGFISLRKNNQVAARNYLLKSVEQNPTAQAYYLLGGIAYVEAEQKNSLQKYKEAEQYLKQSLMKNPRFFNASLMLAKVYMALGDNENAKLNAEQAIRNTKEQKIINEAQAILEMN